MWRKTGKRETVTTVLRQRSVLLNIVTKSWDRRVISGPSKTFTTTVVWSLYSENKSQPLVTVIVDERGDVKGSTGDMDRKGKRRKGWRRSEKKRDPELWTLSDSCLKGRKCERAEIRENGYRRAQ